MLRRFLSLGIIFPPIASITADRTANFGYFGLLNNINNYSESLTAPINAGAGVTLTSAQFNQGIINITAASGGFNLTLPATNTLVAGLGPTVQLDGTYAEPFQVLNNGSGQTATLTAGDANTTINGTATVANNTCRMFLMTVNATNVGSAPTITIQNLGTKAL